MRTLYETLFLVLSAIVFTALAEAHPGSLARDGCHRDNAAGERHFHAGGTHERAGACTRYALPNQITALSNSEGALVPLEICGSKRVFACVDRPQG